MDLFLLYIVGKDKLKGNNMEQKNTTPLFRYIGGKSWLREHLRRDILNLLSKNTIDTYVEPFAGGLGAFLGVHDILSSHGVKNIILNDINKKLIILYKMLYENPQGLIQEYMKIENAFRASIPVEAWSMHKAKQKDELKIFLINASDFFKAVRNDFNVETDELQSASQLLFLQNHCFNGIYRENSKGGYNTPFNWEAKYITEERLLERVSAIGKVFNNFNITFTNNSYSELDYNKESLYYLDPPYINEIDTLENKYNKDCFTLNNQKELIRLIKDCVFLYSNHDNELLINEFNKNNMNIEILKIPRKNIISSSNESRKTDKLEILIYSK